MINLPAFHWTAASAEVKRVARQACLRAGLSFLILCAAVPEGSAQEGAAVESEIDCEKAATAVYEQVAPAVVRIMAFGIDPFRAKGRISASTGSGVVLPDGHVLTSFHVVAGATAIAVGADDELFDASVVGRDPLLDVVVLSVSGIEAATQPIQLAPEERLVHGQPVYVVGYPLGIGKSISGGIISGLGRFIPLNTSSWLTSYIQTDAAVSLGNSGGPLVDECGKMIGMISLRSAAPGAENIGYAIPVATLSQLLPELVETGKVARPWHGLYGQMLTPLIAAMMGVPLKRGFLVETVEPGSAADRAGIRGGTLPVQWGMQEIILGGDIITSVNGMRLQTLDDATSAVRALEIGQTVEITLVRQGQEMKVSAKISERPVLERDLELYRRN